MPQLLCPAILQHPAVPDGLETVRFAHVTDFHVRKNKAKLDQAAEALAEAKVDYLLLTGDYPDSAFAAEKARDAVATLIDGAKPRLGTLGVFGNHDGADVRDACADLPVNWLNDDAAWLEGLPVLVAGLAGGLNVPGDMMTLAERVDARLAERTEPCLKLLLAHYPTVLPVATDFGFDVQFSGHMHGGQIRLPGGKALYNSTDWPLRLSAGVIQHQQTLLCLSRGIGNTMWPIRWNCPYQIPLVTFRQGPLQEVKSGAMELVEKW